MRTPTSRFMPKWLVEKQAMVAAERAAGDLSAERYDERAIVMAVIEGAYRFEVHITPDEADRIVAIRKRMLVASGKDASG